MGQLSSLGAYLSPDDASRAYEQAEELLGDCLDRSHYPNHAGLLHYQVRRAWGGGAWHDMT